MGKKRKASGRNEGMQNGSTIDVGNSKQRISTFEDVADSDDDFHINRDKVLLDEAPEAKRRRKWQEDEEFLQPSDEEVLDYSEPDEDEDSEDDDDGGADWQDDRVDGGGIESDEDRAQESEEDEEGWGTSRKVLYGADAIETEEQALEEEAEARRLQKKQLQAMSAADYGFDESDWQNDGKTKTDDEAHASQAVVTEVLPQLHINKNISTAEKLKLLKARYPEFEPLSKELVRMESVYNQLEARHAAHGLVDPDVTRNLETKMQAATAYRGALGMYFALLTSTVANGQSDVLAMAPAQLREHPVMDTLFKCRELWSRADRIPWVAPGASKMKVPKRLFGGDDLEETSSAEENQIVVVEPKRNNRSRKERHADAISNATAARKAEQMERTEAGLADLDNLIRQKSSKKRKSNQQAAAGGEDSDLGEEAPLTAQEAAEKAKHKKSLRFYTSQIAQKANKRGAAGRSAGGDDDIPYRERLKDRQARLNAEAEARARKPAQKGEELGGESDEEDYAQARKIRGEATGSGSEDDYYDMVAARASKKKTDKAALAEAQKKAALQGGQVVQEETVGADGKRKISYAIEKNRGLTPHRKKDVRNPRVKKRKKYDEKKKKLSSIKPVYKGGEGRGGYGGEMTGIKKGLVKSTKL